jgi:hypothetical protein
MNSLTLVPLGEHYINPLEIAAISPHPYGSFLTLRGNQTALLIKLPINQVIDRLQRHFEPPIESPVEVGMAFDIARTLAPFFPNYSPTTVADGVSALVATISSKKGS